MKYYLCPPFEKRKKCRGEFLEIMRERTGGYKRPAKALETLGIFFESKYRDTL
jgi:hypothetical protein